MLSFLKVFVEALLIFTDFPSISVDKFIFIEALELNFSLFVGDFYTYNLLLTLFEVISIYLLPTLLLHLLLLLLLLLSYLFLLLVKNYVCLISFFCDSNLFSGDFLF